MNHRLISVAALAAAVFGMSSCSRQPSSVTWHAAASVESGDAGYDMGVSAMYAGVAGDALVIAGGANFPDTPAAEGGSKAFYDHIYAYDGSGWRRIGTLPEPAAYGVCYSCGDRLVVAGGANVAGAMKDVYTIEISENTAVISSCAALPRAAEQAAGTSADGRLYLFGGIADGEPSAALYMLDTESDGAQWHELASAPEPMVQPVMAASGGRLYVWGGFDSATKQVSGNGYCYDIQDNEWRAIASHPDGGTFTGASAVTLADGRILCAGGVDREIFAAALRLPADKTREYLSQPAETYRFQRRLHIFDPATGEWSSAGEAECAARAGASMMAFGGGVWILGGELKPGIRTPENYYTSDFN